MMILWVVGLVTIVPYSTYYLLFQAERSEYALLIVLVLFWIFGFWGIVSPILTLLKVRRFFNTIKQCRSPRELAQHFHNEVDEESIIDMISTESKIPKFIARRLYHAVVARLRQRAQESEPRG
jgi:hypothetical protein